MKLFQIDAFTDAAFGGNPAAVVVLTKAPDAAWMQHVAMEMNLSETAFAWPHEDPFARAWRLRWFTPAVEVDLCGHATLATAFVLWREGYLRPDQTASFATASGRLSAEYSPTGLITLDFPVKQPEPFAAPADILAALGTEAVAAARHGNDVLIEVVSAEMVRSITPDFAALAKTDARAVMVTARDEAGEYDIVSRFFAPKGGVDEDPVTGSAHCLLTPYWSEKHGKTELVAHQASARGGVLQVALVGDRVRLSGKAVAVMQGELLV